MRQTAKITDHIVHTLLEVGDLVAEVSRGGILTRIWLREGGGIDIDKEQLEGRNIDEVRDNDIIAYSAPRIAQCFATGQREKFQYSIIDTKGLRSYQVKVLPVHPQEDYLFVVVENIAASDMYGVVEDRWKVALDASGDGMWDVNMKTDTILFSDKWHELFGYSAEEIKSGTDWAEKIHPDDYAAVQQRIAAHMQGLSPIYSSEFRYRCKNGEYKWVMSRGVLVSRDEHGRPVRAIGTHTDINRLKVVETRLSDTARLLAHLMDNLHSGILVTDGLGKVIFANHAYCDMFGIEGGNGRLEGAGMLAVLLRSDDVYKDATEVRERFAQLLQHKDLALYEEVELADGRVLSMDYIPLLLGNNGKGEIWKFTDITQQKNIENRLALQRVFYEDILNNMAADIVVFDTEKRYLFINPHAVKNRELREWMIGRTDEEYCRLRNKPMDMVERRWKIIERVKKERRPVEWEEKLVNPKTGALEYHLRNLYPVMDKSGEIKMFIGYGLDITDLIAAREALKTSINTFENAFNYSGIGMALLSPEGKWLDVNNAICNITGYQKEELLHLSIYDITLPADRDADSTFLRQMLRKEIKTFTQERRIVSKGQKIVWLSLTVSLVWAEELPKFFIVQVVDITAEKGLTDEIKLRNVQLEVAKVSLMNKIEQLEELSRIIAHNLRGPAGNIRMLSEVLTGTGEEAESMSGIFTQQEAAELIRESVVALMNNLDVLMEITQIKLNNDIPYNDCDFAEVTNEVLAQLHAAIYEKHAEVSLDFEVAAISYPKVYLESILYNLLSNALKYTIPGAVPKISVSTRLAGGRVQLRVKDNGLGIDMDRYHDRVFKLNQTFHTGYDSKGLGLYITKTQIESLGGSIMVESRPDEGSEFIVTL